MNNYVLLDETGTGQMVSVAMLAYNHEKFIVQAIESVLIQKTNFKVQLVIAEDFSTDHTRSILIDYQKRFPDKIKLILQESNVGAKKNNLVLLSNLDGKYIAALEGDDYWIDPLKLQKQVDIMQLNPSCSLCFHDAREIYDNKDKTPVLFSERYKEYYTKDMFTHADIIRNDWFISTPTLLFKRDALIDIGWIAEVYSGDYALHLIITKHGDAIYIPEVMAVARKHAGGVSQTQDLRLKIERSINQQKIFAGYVDEEYKKIFHKRIVAFLLYVIKSRSTSFSIGFRLRCLSDVLKFAF